jgi:hypothetical protein
MKIIIKFFENVGDLKYLVAILRTKIAFMKKPRAN